jgi:hypothetical protein
MPASVSRPEETALFLADRCAELEAENAKLRDQLRWRKWPEEKPTPRCHYLVLTDGSCDVGTHVSYYSVNIGWATEDAGITYWRPIAPLPGGE